MNFLRKIFGASLPTNLPHESDFYSYKEIISKYVKYLSQFDEIMSIYQLGSIGVIGISDIDFLIVLDESKLSVNLNSKKYSIYNIYDKTEKIIAHDAFIIPDVLFQNLNYISTFFNYKLLFKRAGRRSFPLIQNSKKELLFIHLLDIVHLSINDEFHTLSNQFRLNALLTIARINSQKYPLRLVSELGLSDSCNEFRKINNFIKNFDNLRQSWFKFNFFISFVFLRKNLFIAKRNSSLFRTMVMKINSKNKFITCNNKNLFNSNLKFYKHFFNNEISLINQTEFSTSYLNAITKRSEILFRYYKFIDKYKLNSYVFYDIRKRLNS